MKSELKVVKILSVLFMIFVAILMTSCGGGDGEKDDIEAPWGVDLLSAVAGDGGVTLIWWEPHGGGFDHVEITWSPEGGTPQIVAAGVESYTAIGLTNGTDYTFTVKTVDDSGNVSSGVTVSATPAVQKMFGGNKDDVAYSISRTDDGGYIVAGYSESTDLPYLVNDGGSDCYIIKLDSNGSLDWQKLHGSVNDDVARSVQQTDDGGYIVAGSWEVITGEKDDFYVIKLNANGNRSWERACGGSNYDMAYSCQQTDDGGYIVGGESFSSDIPGLIYNGRGDFYIVKLDSNGGTSWQKMFGGNDWDRVFSLQQTADGGYVVAGISESADIPGLTHKGLGDFYMAKLDSNGNISWQKMFGGNSLDRLWSVQQTNDGGYIVAGSSQSTDIPGLIHPYFVEGYEGYAPPAAYMAKLNASGDISWQKMYDAVAAQSIQQTSDGGYIFTGGTYQCCIVKLDSGGNISWEKTYGGNGDNWASSIEQTGDGGYIIAGRSNSTDIPGLTNSGSFDCYIIKLD